MTKASRIRLVFLMASSFTAHASVASQVDTSTLKSLGLSRKEIKQVRQGEVIQEEEEETLVEEEVDDEEEPWKQNEEWWKDPLAMFSDDEAEEEEMPPPPPQEEIDESVPIVEEATSLGDDIAVDEPETVQEEEVEVIEAEASLVEEEEDVTDEQDTVITPDEPVETETVPEVAAEPPKVATEPPKVATPVVESEPEVIEKKKPLKVVKPTKKKSESRGQVADLDKGGGSSSMTSPLALLVPLVPKLQGALSNVPLAQLAASAIIVKFGIDKVNNRKRLANKQESSVDVDHHQQDEEDELSEDLDEDSVDVSAEDDMEDEDEESLEAQEKIVVTPHRGPGWIKGVRDKFARSSGGERLPSARELYAQVKTLEQQLEKVETERHTMETEYEKASFQVQEQASEIKSLTTTTKYLKAQLRDNEEVQNKAIRAERRKAKEELARMKGAMVAVLDKERKAMREELRRQTTELRSLLREATNGDVES